MSNLNFYFKEASEGDKVELLPAERHNGTSIANCFKIEIREQYKKKTVKWSTN